jgi:hypothetical protein
VRINVLRIAITDRGRGIIKRANRIHLLEVAGDRIFRGRRCGWEIFRGGAADGSGRALLARDSLHHLLARMHCRGTARIRTFPQPCVPARLLLHWCSAPTCHRWRHRNAAAPSPLRARHAPRKWPVSRFPHAAAVAPGGTARAREKDGGSADSWLVGRAQESWMVGLNQLSSWM